MTPVNPNFKGVELDALRTEADLNPASAKVGAGDTASKPAPHCKSPAKSQVTVLEAHPSMH